MGRRTRINVHGMEKCSSPVRRSSEYSKGIKRGVRTQIIHEIGHYARHRDTGDQLCASQSMEQKPRIGRRHAATNIALEYHLAYFSFLFKSCWLVK